MTVDLRKLLASGHGAEHVDMLDGGFRSALEAMIAAAPPEIGAEFGIQSGYRSPERQATLFDQAVKKYGSEQAARKWVAPPGRSRHNGGVAVDLSFASPNARQWAHDNAAAYGMAFPMDHEPWHMEMAGSRGGAAPKAQNPAAMGPIPAPEPGQGPQTAEQGGLGAVLAALAPQAGQMAEQMAPEMPRFGGTGREMEAVMGAQQGMQQARGLQGALRPDVEAMTALGKRRVV